MYNNDSADINIISDGIIRAWYNKRGFAHIRLNNPPVNALSAALVKELYNAIVEIDRNKDIKFLILDGSGKHFSAGADLKERALYSNEDTLRFINNLNDCFDLIENLEIPIICFISGGGVALGGGAELALCCDIIVGKGDGSKVGFPETALGIIPAAGGTYRIYKKMNQGLAKYWILTGKQFSIEEAFDIGFVDLIIKDDSEIEELFLNNSRTSLIAAKKSINKCYLESDRKKQRLIEFVEYKKTLSSPERKKALEKYKKK